MSNVIRLHTLTKLELPIDVVLDAAKDANLSEVIVLGYDEEGELYIACSDPDMARAVFLLRQAEHVIISDAT